MFIQRPPPPLGKIVGDDRGWEADSRMGVFVRMRHKSLRADAVLLLAALLWGVAFVPQRVAMRHMGPLTFTGVRFALGAMVLVPIIAMRSRRRTTGQPISLGPTGDGWRPCLAGGALAGMVLFVAVSLQQTGLVYTTAGKAAFITGFYVPLVPVLGFMAGQRTRIATWIGAILSVAGLYFLSVVESLEINRGDLLEMIGAVVWAIHVLLIGRLAPRTDPLKLGLVQFSTVAIASLIGALPAEQMTAEGLRAAMWAILYGGVVSAGIAYTLQLFGQRHAPPGHAALVLSLEAVFAAVAGFLVLNERFEPREWFGAAVMLGGMLISQVNRLRSIAAATTEHVGQAQSAESTAVLD